MRYKKKPLVIEAVKAGQNGFEEKPEWLSEAIRIGRVIAHHYFGTNFGFSYFSVYTLEGLMHGHRGDYIVRGIDGELYPCKGDIFEKTYELIEEE